MSTDPKVTLVTPRLVLREFTLDDLDFLAEMLADPEVMRYYPKVATRDEARESLERQFRRYEQDGHGPWLVALRESGQPIGRCGVAMQEVDGQREPEVGYMLHRPFWKQGFALEAATACRDWALHVRGYAYVISLVGPENTPSQAVARRMGMQPWKETMFHELKHIVFRIDRRVEAEQARGTA
jgi:RimJ/RimL family protein N-acetyltransferase